MHSTILLLYKQTAPEPLTHISTSDIYLPMPPFMVPCRWVFELVIMFAGALPDADVAVSVMGIGFHLTAWCYMIPMSIASAANTRMANELGAGHAHAARRVFRTALLMVLCCQVGGLTRLNA